MSKQILSREINIVGAGIIAYLASYMAFKSALQKNQKIKIDIFEKHHSMNDTTVMHLVPSLTPDEMLSVIPPVDELLAALQLSFKEDGGIRVDDVGGINNSIAAENFISQIKANSNSENIRKSQQLLLQVGRRSMELWDEIYQNADAEFQKIMQDANYNPCKKLNNHEEKLHNGYRIDLVLKIKNAAQKTALMAEKYCALGFADSRTLSPEEVLKIDPFLKDFVMQNSDGSKWNEDASALWRPGGGINTAIFLPKLHQYLNTKLGTYVDIDGKTHDCFKVHYGCEVQSVDITEDKITALNFVKNGEQKKSENLLQNTEYLFCPGESVGTLKKLGFIQPADAGFAGASLLLNVKVPSARENDFLNFSHCMEVHKNGLVFAWQARYAPQDKMILLGIAGSKAFYANVEPKINEEFCTNRNLLQLNVINQIVPEVLSLALGKNTHGKDLTINDLHYLENEKIAKRWVARRTFAFDGMPTIGALSTLDGKKIINARTINHAGSGGVSYGPALVEIWQKIERDEDIGEYSKILNPNRAA